MPVTRSDIVLRVSNDAANRQTANSFVTYEEMVDLVKFRVDRQLWDERSEDEQVRAMVAAYEDVVRLPFSRRFGRSQSMDNEWVELFGEPAMGECPLEDPEFVWSVRKCQAIQTLYILGGTQVRDMAREGVLGTRAVAGRNTETFFAGYRGPVCVEAIEVIARHLNLMPSMRRFL
ncbi:hypothetical protein [Azospirillum sp. Sh1]|uniref:hypothetical protein n=1 Tax=Azospirillum sp. Sh1 TaxID=2607285 RepID=UPI0011ECFC98|nr:hypothetical protein [Azospirillum sp. Sh1]KAA0573360.1 hypothetical protein FZ029_20475 [Azospirillum sp. Sh1]